MVSCSSVKIQPNEPERAMQPFFGYAHGLSRRLHLRNLSLAGRSHRQHRDQSHPVPPSNGFSDSPTMVTSCSKGARPRARLNCCGRFRLRRTVPRHAGEMAEWLKAHAWKACIGETLSRVRIPLSPPLILKKNLQDRCLGKRAVLSLTGALCNLFLPALSRHFTFYRSSAPS
jgi:hypothetical protein